MDTLSTLLCIGGIGAAAYGLSKGKRGHTTLAVGVVAVGTGLVRAAYRGDHIVGASAAERLRRAPARSPMSAMRSAPGGYLPTRSADGGIFTDIAHAARGY